MNISLPNTASSPYLRKCDEIKILPKYAAKALNFIEKYPEKRFVLCLTNENKDITNKELAMLMEKSNGNLTIELADPWEPNRAHIFKKLGIPFYWHQSIKTFADLKAVKEFGCSQALIDTPIFFDLDNVKRFGLETRVIANMAHDFSMPREDGLHGSWLLPQDQDLYEPYITTIEFLEINSTRLEALFDIYKENKNYYGDLNVLFKGFNAPSTVLAQAIPRDVRESRLNCKQRCTIGRCALCDKGLQVGLKVQKDVVEQNLN